MASPEQLPDMNFPSSIRDIERLITPEGSLYASSGEGYQYMLFGRDSLEAADDLVEVEPQLSLRVIDSLARLQGTQYNEQTAEEFGKIPHQHMQLHVDGVKIPEAAEEQLHKLSRKWGGTDEGFTYYGSLDATPLFARLIARHGLIHGPDFLRQEVEHTSGETISRLESYRRALHWICDHLESSELSLLEFRRLGEDHIIIQSWRDSGSSYVHEDGTQVNLDGFIAPIEVQGYGYDALSLSSRLLADFDLPTEETDRWVEHARQLQQTTLNAYWMEDKNAFAMALDRDPGNNWRERRVSTPSSSQAALLDSRLLIDLSEAERKQYVEGIINQLYDPDFMTEIGVRCRAASAAELVPFADYHGSWAVWTKENYDFIKGLRRQGLQGLADDVSIRLLNMANISGENYEFLYVNPEGEVDYMPKPYAPGMEVDEVIPATNVPETGQAWTASALLAIKRQLEPRNKLESDDWSKSLEDTVLRKLPENKLHRSQQEIHEKRQSLKRFAIDIDAGIEADKSWNPDWWQ
jgi:glycogen debranching enzyme